MASSAIDTATDLGRKVVNRAQTVVGDDWREVKRQARDFAKTFRSEALTRDERDGCLAATRRTQVVTSLSPLRTTVKPVASLSYQGTIYLFL